MHNGGAKVLLAGLAVVIVAGGYLVMKLSPNQTLEAGSDQPVISKPCSNNIVVVPHIEGASEFRQAFWSGLDLNCQPQAIVVISPNHYLNGIKPIIVTGKDWTISSGTVIGDQSLARQLETESVLYDDEAFIKEHGVTNLLNDLNTYYKSVPVIAAMVGTNATFPDIEELGESLKAVCQSCLIIGSVDFSHSNPEALANVHDRTTIRELQSLDSTGIQDSETDASMVLTLLIELAKANNNQGFKVDSQGCVASQADPDSSECTTYVIGSFIDTPTDTEKMTSFTFAGDIMLDRLVYHVFKDSGYEKMWSNWGKRRFWGTDISMVNLEGPISENEISDDYTSGSMVFNFPPESIDAIKYAGINVVSLANNHTLNAGKGGLVYTKKILSDNHIDYIGNPNMLEADSVKDYNTDIPLRIITVNYLENPDTDWILDKIKEADQSGRSVIIYPHWGNEYQTTANSVQVNLAHQFIDAGADIIIGSHPHVIQNIEIYNNRPIIYSLGNFIFDQTFSKPTQRGLLVTGIISTEKIEIDILPTKQVDLKPAFLTGEEKRTTLDALLQSVESYIKNDTIVIDI